MATTYKYSDVNTEIITNRKRIRTINHRGSLLTTCAYISNADLITAAAGFFLCPIKYSAAIKSIKFCNSILLTAGTLALGVRLFNNEVTTSTDDAYGQISVAADTIFRADSAIPTAVGVSELITNYNVIGKSISELVNTNALDNLPDIRRRVQDEMYCMLYGKVGTTIQGGGDPVVISVEYVEGSPSEINLTGISV